MAKGVYDALLRADEERRKRVGSEGPAPEAERSVPPEDRPAPPVETAAPPASESLAEHPAAVVSERAVSSSLGWQGAETSERPAALPFWKRWFARADPELVEDTVEDVNKRRISLLQPDSYVTEQYRMLRGRIDSLAAQRPLKTVGVASANPGEGKSTSAINLALVTAMGVGRQVLLVDCDLRRPKVHKSLGLDIRASGWPRCWSAR